MGKKWITHSFSGSSRLEELFKKLDVNKDEILDMSDFIQAQSIFNIHVFPGQARAYFQKYDHDGDGKIDYFDFIDYYIKHEKILRWSFDRIDYNKDGHIDVEDIKESLGVSRSEAEVLLRRLARRKTLRISWIEWRDFHVLNPYVDDMYNLLRYWQCSALNDLGEEHLLASEDMTEPPGRWWRLLVAGGVAGGASRTITAPLDRIKVILQVHGHSQKQLGIFSCYRKMLQEGGMKSLWRGNGINVLKVTPEMAIRFCVYEQIKQRWVAPGQDLTLLDRLLCGSLAGATAQTAIYPLEVIKTRLILCQTGQYNGVLDCATKMHRTEGIRTFFKGYAPNILGILPYAGIDLAVYETLKDRYEQAYNTEASDLMCGAIAAVSTSCGQLCTYPLALVRTKLQAQTSGVKTHTPMSLFCQIVVTEGVRGLWRGIVPNMLKATPAMSAHYIIYERMRKHLGIPSKKKSTRSFEDFGTFCPKKPEKPEHLKVWEVSSGDKNYH